MPDLRPLAALLLFAAVLAACTTEPPADTEAPATAEPPGPVEPAQVAQAGYVPVRIALPADLPPADVTAVTVGGVRAYDLAIEPDGRLRATVQGHPQPGPAEVVLQTAQGPRSLGQVLRHEPPAHPAFARVVAVGASLTQGVQRGVPGHHGALRSPAAQVAKQLGGWFPLPLLLPGLFPGVGPADLGPPPTCSVPDVAGLVSKQTGQVLGKLKDPATGSFGYQHARIDPDLLPHNLAVGGSNLGDLLRLPAADDVGVNFVGHLVFDPYGEFLGPMTSTQLEHLLAIQPTLVLSTDLYGNDLIAPVVTGDGLDLSRATPEAQLYADLRQAVDQLAATGAEVFLANLPPASDLPAAHERKAQMVAAAAKGLQGKAADDARQQAATDADALLGQIDARIAAANARLAEEAARHPNVHVVDFAAEFERIRKEGLVVGGHTLGVGKLQGLLGLDGLHFSDTGYALVANLFVDAINAELGTAVPRIDLAAVLAADPDAPAALQAAGLDVGACQ